MMTTPVAELSKVRQTRVFTDEPVSDEHLHQLLEVARWSGSSQNTQPWHFVVIRDRERLAALSKIRSTVAWANTAPLAIALVITTGNETSGAFDEGRLTERLLIAARFLGLGAGTGWFGDSAQQAEARELLGIPSDLILRSMVVIGHPDPAAPTNSPHGGRKSLDELVSFERMG